MRKNQNYKRRIIFFLCYAVFFIFLMEINLRIAGYVYRTLSLYPAKTLNKKIFRIYCFGDSFTFGDGASPKDNYPRQLERMLNNASGIKFQVFNLGIPGANSSQSLKYLQKILFDYAKPDLIIIRIGVNDCWNFADNNFSLIWNKDNTIGKVKMEELFNNFELYKLIRDLIIKVGKDNKYKPFEREENNPKYTKIDPNEFKKLVEFNIINMIKLAQSKGVRVILQNYPGGDVYGPDTIANIAKHFSIPMVDVFSAFNEKLKEVKREDIFAPYWKYSHPNAKGYNIMAEEIYRVMGREGFVNDTSGLLKNNK